jgi:hypothetical protein
MNKTREEHESYGLVKFSRVNWGGKRTLFGSAIRDHHNTIQLTISRATVEHDLGSNHYYDKFPAIVEIELSAHQFAELLTTMNIGTGTPCTILSVGKDAMEDPPYQTLESEKIVSSFENDSKTFATEIVNNIKELRKILDDKKPLKVSEKKIISGLLDKIERELVANTPFRAEMFKEAAEKMIASAKAEVDSWINQAIQWSGIKALRENNNIDIKLIEK